MLALLQQDDGQPQPPGNRGHERPGKTGANYCNIESALHPQIESGRSAFRKMQKQLRSFDKPRCLSEM
jgi:hypothetical protein